MGIGTRLNELLESKGIRPGTLATETGISKNTIYSIIRRNNEKVDYSIIEKIANHLDVPIDYFFPSSKHSMSDNASYIADSKVLLLIEKYSALDAHGKRVVDFLLNEEYTRSTNAQIPVAIAAKSVDGAPVAMPTHLPADAKARLDEAAAASEEKTRDL